MLCERDTMGFRDRLSDLREDIEFKGNERQSGKTVEKLCKVLSGSDFAMKTMHLEMNTEKTDALFLMNHNGHAVYGWIMCIYPFKDEVKEDPNAEPKFLIQAQMELREDATWPNDADFTIRDANGRFAGEREAGFERNSSVFYNTEFRGKKVTYAKMCSKTFRVKKTYPASIMDSPAEAEKAMRDFVALLGRSVIQFSPQIESMLVRNQSGTSGAI